MHTLHYITLPYLTLHYITLHYIIYMTWHYITLHNITYIHTCMHTCMHASIRPSIHPPSIHPSIHQSIHPSIHTYIHTYTYTCTYTYTYTYTFTYTHTYTHTYTYTYTIHYVSLRYITLHAYIVHVRFPPVCSMTACCDCFLKWLCNWWPLGLLNFYPWTSLSVVEEKILQSGIKCVRGGEDLNNDLACSPLLCRAEGGRFKTKISVLPIAL